MPPRLDGRQRVVIEDVAPEIDAGRFPIKRTVGESVHVRAAVFADGHDEVSCHVLYRSEGEEAWQSEAMKPLGNDLWDAEFRVWKMGRCRYTVEGWIDRFKTWRADIKKRITAGQELSVELAIGAELIARAAERASGDDAVRLQRWAETVRGGDSAAALSEQLFATMQRYPDLTLATRYERELMVWVDRPKARFSTWYEFFPRSTSPIHGHHGTFRDSEARLAYAVEMGFDVIYLPPIHPIGVRYRKGKNNTPTAESTDVGSPWAIGNEDGGHTAIHPDLGTLEDFQALLHKAA
ncbi:MAG TPA: maltotransferase domain-containing protein, partial [Candidatus Acidoferrum sp.]|nr:maltotransferase domain-containing protein [Candidatus Acidoferrum sp.]